MRKRILTAILLIALTLGMVASCKNSDAEIIGSDAEAKNKNLVVIDITLTDDDYGIGVSKNKPELLAQLNKFLDEIKEDGTYEKITGHYFGGGGDPVSIPANEIRSDADQLIVATTGDFEPFDYDIGEEHFGIDKELIKAFADYIGKELVLVNVNFDLLFMTVYQGKCDACIAGITINDERSEYVDFSKPYFEAGLCIAASKDNNTFDGAKTREDVEKILSSLDPDTVIAVESKTTGQEYIEGTYDSGFKGVSCTVMQCSTLNECIEALHNGTCDYVIADNAPLKYLIAHD